MREDERTRPRPVGQRLLGAALMACGVLSLALAVANRGSISSTSRPPADSVQVLGEVIDRAGSTERAGEPGVGQAPAAVAGAVSPPSEPVTSSSPPPSSPSTSRPASSSRPDRTTTTVGSTAVSNRPIDLRIEISPSAPASGERVTVIVNATDPDAALQPPLVCVTADGGGSAMGFEGDNTSTVSCTEPARCSDRDEGGGAVSPVFSEGHWVMELDVRGPDTYTVRVFIASGPKGCSNHPFASEAETSRQVSVSA